MATEDRQYPARRPPSTDEKGPELPETPRKFPPISPVSPPTANEASGRLPLLARERVPFYKRDGTIGKATRQLQIPEETTMRAKTSAVVDCHHRGTDVDPAPAGLSAAHDYWSAWSLATPVAGVNSPDAPMAVRSNRGTA